MDVLLPSDPEAAENWFRELRKMLAELPDGKNRFALEILFREAVQNALAHGNCNKPEFSIRCRLNIHDGKAWGSVSHQGPGQGNFCTDNLPSDAQSENGRGMSIIARYSDEYEWDDDGRTISFTRRLD